MPESPWNDIGPLAVAFGIVASVAVPIGALLRALPGPRHERPRLMRFSDLEMIVLIALAFLLPGLWHSSLELLGVFSKLQIQDAKEQDAIARLAALAMWLGFVLMWLHARGFAPLRAASLPQWRRDVAAGVTAFVLLTPVTFAVFFIASLLVSFFGGTPDKHPLTEFNTSTPAGLIGFVLLACVAAPIFEESIFRGLLLPWARARRLRPWLLFALAVVMLLAGKGVDHLGTMLFLVDLSMFMAFATFGREIWKRWPSRSASAVFTTAALFGAMHSAVWPTPIPLTVLGLGLGILTLRRGSVRPAIVCHALFNAVSVVYVLRRTL